MCRNLSVSSHAERATQPWVVFLRAEREDLVSYVGTLVGPGRGWPPPRLNGSSWEESSVYRSAGGPWGSG
jgi:hypothetical protein